MPCCSNFLTFIARVRQLIQCKADPNTVNEHGNTPLHYACFWGQDEVAEVHSTTHPQTLTMCWLKGPSSGGKRPLQCCCFVKQRSTDCSQCLSF